MSAARSGELALVVTMGEPAGIGTEVTLKAWMRRKKLDLPAFAYVGDPALPADTAAMLGIDVPIREISSINEAVETYEDALPVLSVPLKRPVRPGRPEVDNTAAVTESIALGVRLSLAGEALGVVTNPVHKATLQDGGFAYPGHTDYIAELCGNGQVPVMMLTCPGLRVAPVTVHRALRDAVQELTEERIVEAGEIVLNALRHDFAIEVPQLAVAGLNPHAGEDGRLGSEEIEIIAPAIRRLRQRNGGSIEGPLAADSLFHAEARAHYDAALCMYHDQALIPLKTIDFAHGVNITLGLPIVRTSPDHGTALDIAGTGRASWSSFVTALWTASLIARRRKLRA